MLDVRANGDDLTDYDKAEVEGRLKRRAEEIASRRRRLRAGDDAMRDGGDLADYDQHPADTGTETFEQELDETTDMLLADEARQIDVALGRLADGSYGKCIDCGQEIPAERLAAIPESVRCIDDQRRYEGQLREAGPPRQAP